MNRKMTLFIIAFLAGGALIAYGLYAKYFYTHPADYTEGTVRVLSGEKRAMSGEQEADSSTSTTTPSSTEKSVIITKPAPVGPEVAIDGVTFHVDIADTIPKQVQGLSGRDPLRSDQGMLFIFPWARNEGFWMYDMKFALDIIWIKDTTIIGISPDLPPPAEGQASSTLPIYYPPSPVDKVLEVNAGTAAKYGFKVGDRVNIRLSTGSSQ